MDNNQKMALQTFTVEPIGIVHSCFTEKFGIPRQPGMVKHSTAQIELYAPYNRAEMVRGLERFSHLWVQFLFHRVVEEGWRSTVRPPRLGGQKRVGIFACRSPHRPNHIGLSVVRLESIEFCQCGPLLHLSGIDLLDKTPVLDIKPYVPYSDSVAAHDSFTSVADAGVSAIREVCFSKEAEKFCESYERRYDRPLRKLIEEVLAQDPRPRAQLRSKKDFGISLWQVNIRWRIEDESALVLSCSEMVD